MILVCVVNAFANIDSSCEISDSLMSMEEFENSLVDRNLFSGIAISVRGNVPQREHVAAINYGSTTR